MIDWLRLHPLLFGTMLILAGCEAAPKNNAVPVETPVPAAVTNDGVPSCYRGTPLEPRASKVSRAIFVLVDQTTGLDDRLRAGLKANVLGVVRTGTAFSIATFSAYSRGHYTTTAASGVLEAPIAEANSSDLSVRGLERLSACLGGQHAYVNRLLTEEIDKATGASAESFANSEILSSLAQLSRAVRESPATDKLVIIASDLLEHSTTSSFYQDRNLRVLNPAEEMAKAKEVHLVGDFDGARVYVVGTGLLSPQSDMDMVRDAKARAALRDFWRQWFKESNAELVELGEPELVSPIR
jgi:hypothetical protein